MNLRYADAVFTGEIENKELRVFDASGEIDLGARLVGVDDEAVAWGTRIIMDQVSGKDGGPGTYRINIAQHVPRSLLGAAL